MCQKKIMRKRIGDQLSGSPPKKRISPGGNLLPHPLPYGEILTDLTGKKWKVGKTIGCGGFGEIYLVTDDINNPVKSDAKFVAKIESHKNGPLFVEINCLLRIGRQLQIEKWKEENKMENLGIANYVASGSHKIYNEKLRFLILPRYEQDLEKIFLAKNKKFNLKTVLLIAKQIIDVLEYIHTNGYVHCDIKASNVLHSVAPKICVPTTKSTIRRHLNPIRSCRNRRNLQTLDRRCKKPINYNEDDINNLSSLLDITEQHKQKKNHIIVIDYGLATKFRHPDGTHKQFFYDGRKAHAGTILFCSTDAHNGASSRRSDMETLGYNMIYWLTSTLPWENFIHNPDIVQEKKEMFLSNIDNFLNVCFTSEPYPQFLYEYFQHVTSLDFESMPDYELCRKLFTTAIKEYGYINDGLFDFDNLEGWGQRSRKNLKTKPTKNKVIPKKTYKCKQLSAEKPILRNTTEKKLKKVKLFASDPEIILRHTKKSGQELTKIRERKLTDSSDTSGILNLDIDSLNPTYAMIEVYNKCKDRNSNINGYSKRKHDSMELDHCEGYTPAMNLILTKMNQRRLEEIENHCVNVPIKIKTKAKNIEKKKTRKQRNVVPMKELRKNLPHRSLRLKNIN